MKHNQFVKIEYFKNTFLIMINELLILVDKLLFCISGEDKLTLYERAFLGGLKTTILCESEGLVRSLCWGENFLAWSSNVGVRVYDLTSRCSLGLIKWEEPPG